MPFLIEGSAQQIFKCFGKDDFVQKEAAKDPALIKKDIIRCPFFGNIKQSAHFKETWLDEEQSPSEYFCQGNMFAGNTWMNFGTALPLPYLNKPEETEEHVGLISQSVSKIYLGYVDEDNNLCGLTIHYRKDDPSKWMISHVKNANLPPDQQEMKILTSFDPTSFRQENNGTTIKSTSIDDNTLANAIGSKGLKNFIQQIMNPDGKIKENTGILSLFLQNLFLESDGVDNAELLQAFERDLQGIMANPHLKRLQQGGLISRPSPEQLLACLDEQSELSQLIGAFQPTRDYDTDRHQLNILLFLDKSGLNAIQREVRSDQNFVQRLNSLRNQDKDDFLVNYLGDKRKLKGLRFLLLPGAQGSLKLFEQLTKVGEDDNVWTNLVALADELEWNFPKDNFRHQVICRVLLNLPKIRVEELLNLLKELSSPVLQADFTPIQLAAYITKKGNEAGCLQKAEKYFSQYKKAAAGRQTALSAELKSSVVEKLIENPDDQFLPALSFCSTAKQIEASYVLLGQGCRLELVEAYTQIPSLVYCINRLEVFELEGCISELFKDTNNIVMLEQIYKLRGYQEKQASLILLAQGQLNSKEYFELIDSFIAYPKLANLIIYAHQKKFSDRQLKRLAFDPTLHRAANLLAHYEIDFRFENLTPAFCQALLDLGELSNNARDNKQISAYLKSVLPSMLGYFNDEQDFESLQPLAEASEEPTPEESSLIKELDDFLKGQMHVFALANQFEIPFEHQRMASRVIADELVRVRSLGELNVEDEEIYRQVFKGFSELSHDVKLNEVITTDAVKALLAAYQQNLERASKIEFNNYLQSHNLARAIIGIAECKLSVFELPVVKSEIITALSNLSKVASINKAAYELAMQDNDKGHDFRLLLAIIPDAPIPMANKPPLVDFLLDGINKDRVKVNRDIARISGPKTRNLASRLDESLVFINRLRSLGFDSEVIDFIVKNDDKSRCFYKAIRKIEVESEATITRLKADHPDKFARLIESEKIYRQELYQAMYDALQPNQEDKKTKIQTLATRIQEAEQRILPLLQLDSNAELRWFKAVLVNFASIIISVVTSVLTLGQIENLHERHHKKTGDYFFFTSTKSEESYKTLSREAIEEVSEEIMKPRSGRS